MKPAERAALKSAIKLYTEAKVASKSVALATLVKEGTHTKSGKITAAYGGKLKKKTGAER